MRIANMNTIEGVCSVRTKFCSFHSERWQNERLINELPAGHAEYHVLQHTEQILKPNKRQIFH